MGENKEREVLYEGPGRSAVGEEVADEGVEEEEFGCCRRGGEVGWAEAVEEDEDEEGGEMDEEGHVGFVWRFGVMGILVLRELVYLYLYLCLYLYMCMLSCVVYFVDGGCEQRC